MNDIKKTVDRIKRKEHDLDVKLQASDALLPLSRMLSSKVESKVANNKVAFLQQICSEVGKKIEGQDFKQIVKALEKQTELLEDKSGKKIMESMVGLFQEISKLQDKDHFNQGEFDAVFSRGVERIISALANQDEIPTDTWYFRDANDRMKKVVEQYVGFDITSEYKYDRGGNLINVKTTKNASK